MLKPSLILNILLMEVNEKIFFKNNIRFFNIHLMCLLMYKEILVLDS